MGRVIKTRDVLRRPDALGRRGCSDISRLLESRERAGSPGADDRRRALHLACRIAALIVGDAVEREPAALDRIYERAIGGLEPPAMISIRVHPADRAASGIDRLAGDRGFEVIDDPAVGRGGCRVAWEGTEVDASFAALEAALGEAVG